MTFIEKNLANNEKIIYRGKLHWWIYGRSILLFILGLIIGMNAGKSDGVKAFGGLLVFISLIGLISAYIRASSSEFVVTNRRIMLKTGAAKRRLIELQLNRADGLVIEQGIIGRIFNYGTLVVRSSGMAENFSPIADPYEFKRQVNNAIEGSFAPANSPSAF